MNTADLPAIVNPDTLWDVDAVARYVLRRAMGRAGLVRGYLQVCRRKGCGHEEQAEDSELRHCPDCKMKLWPKALPRHLRFHDLRGTTATLLTRAGVPLVVAQRMLRHADPRLTANVYTRVDLADLRAGVARLPPLGPAKSRFLRCRVAMQPRRGGGCNPGVFQWR